MDATRVLLLTAWGIQLVSPLIPVAAAVAGGRSPHYIRLPWMNRFTATLVFILIVNWILLAMAVCHIHNHWVFNLSLIPEFSLSLWAISGAGVIPLPGVTSTIAMAGALAIALLEWRLKGPWVMWSAAIAYTLLVLFALCAWNLVKLIPLAVEAPDSWRPAFWFLGSWVLLYGIDLLFWPLHDYFLARLTKPFVMVPFLVKFILALIFNITSARTFLCRKSQSS